ncbi:class II aldolase/adducin family protein [Trebonia sp.]|uniref:class II aldolase/adducin family protein n=1 Tax=Trebonia sp. TaxID=2767075 RepID=UPI00262D4F3A|nr:class II aldolase/adducin family protein [Trebonia sp.]
MAKGAEAMLADLVAANRILGREGILDAYGHVSARDAGDAGDGFFLSRARAPQLVEEADLLEFSLAGEPLAGSAQPLYLERYIHAAIYAARPDVGAVCHSHTPSILPFSVSLTPLRSVIHSARFIGTGVPVWDLAREFPGEWSPLVRSLRYGQSLAAALGDGGIVLLRGHGAVVVGRGPQEVVGRCIAMDRNARVQETAHRLGEYTPLHERECEDPRDPGPPLARDNREWEYFMRRAGLL